jgi:hypothetical protein
LAIYMNPCLTAATCFRGRSGPLRSACGPQTLLSSLTAPVSRQAARDHVSRPLSADEASLVARGLAEFTDSHRWERLGHKYLPHR